jgi:ABC-type antimicrobial peptide transport system permease subunit
MVSMNRKLRTALATLGAVSLFIIFLALFTSLVAATIGAAVGFYLIWLLAGFLHWLYSKRTHYTKQWYRFSDDESQNDENLS